MISAINNQFENDFVDLPSLFNIIGLPLQRVCEEDTCQANDPYECLYNLECLDSVSCKKTASSPADCKTGYVYDSETEVCWEGNLTAQNLDFDENGNLISFLGFDYGYNNFNQLVNVSYGANLVAQYFYDADGNRFKKVEGDSVTYYFDNFVQIHNSSGVYNETYYYLYDKLVGKKDTNGDILFYHPDHLGSTTLITDSNGNTVAYLKYNPYGELVNAYDSRYTYTGHELDSETDNIYMKARYYNPGIGVFMQPDNIIGDVYNPQDLNKYAYVRNNPYKYTDPDGEYLHILLGGAIGGVLGGGANLISQVWHGASMFDGTVNWGQVGKSAAAGTAAGIVTGASFGLLGPAAISAVGPEVFLGTTGAASGIAGQATANILNGQSISSNTGEAACNYYIGGISSGPLIYSVGAISTGGRSVGGLSNKRAQSFSQSTPKSGLKANKGAAIITYDDLLPEGTKGYHDTIIPKIDRYNNVYGYNIHGSIEDFPANSPFRHPYSKNVIKTDATKYLDETRR